MKTGFKNRISRVCFGGLKGAKTLSQKALVHEIAVNYKKMSPELLANLDMVNTINLDRNPLVFLSLMSCQIQITACL